MGLHNYFRGKISSDEGSYDRHTHTHTHTHTHIHTQIQGEIHKQICEHWQNVPLAATNNISLVYITVN